VINKREILAGREFVRPQDERLSASGFSAGSTDSPRCGNMEIRGLAS
jgi:hypothetical protein